jgi:transcriptional regulator with XRE-family HTH domain/tetratricopeptide (TPR) repeat protein
MAIVQPVSFGDLLRRYRMARGLTQERLAELAGISANAIAALENGARKTPRRATLAALAEGLALSVKERSQFEAAAHPSLQVIYSAAETGARGAITTPFVGRAGELAMIERFLSSDKPPTQVCSVAGEPGLGKSRLLIEAISLARANGWAILDGGCYRQDGEAPFSPWPRVLLRFLSRRPQAQQRLDLQGCAWLARLLPELAESGLAPLPTWNLAGDQERRLIYTAIGRLLDNVAGPAGTLLALDDLQWAGADALELLASLAREPGGRPLRIMLAYRDTEVAPGGALGMLLADLVHEGLAEHIRLKPLEAAEARELLARLLWEEDGAVHSRMDALTEDVLLRADGVPFFLVSCAADLRLRSPVETKAGWEPPPDVAGSVRQRLVILSPDAQELLKSAAIAGRVTSGALLFAIGAAASMNEARTLAALEEMSRSGLLVEQDGERYAFAHDLMHEVIVSDLSATRRRTLQRRVADALEQLTGAMQARRASELAWRLEAAGEHARALPYMLLAADEAAQANAPAEAERLYRRTVECAHALADEVTEARARSQIGVLLHTIGRFAEATEELSSAIELYQRLGLRDEVAIATQRLSRTYNNAGMVDAGAETLHRTILFLTPGDEEPLAQGGEGLASSRTERALASLSPAAAARLGLSVSKHLLDLGRPLRGFEMIEQAERYARLAGDSYTASHAHSFRADMLAGLGRFTEALETWREAVEMTRRAGNLDILVSTLIMLAQAQIWRGELPEAKRCAQEALEITTTQFGDVTYLIDSQFFLGEIAFFHGEWRAARQYFDAAIASAARDVGQLAGEQRLVSLARLDIAEGHVEVGMRALHGEAEREGNKGLSKVARIFGYEQLPKMLTLAEYELFTGDPDTAARRLQTIGDAPDARFSSLPGLLAQALIRQGRLDEAKALLDRSLPLLRTEGLRLSLIDALSAQAMLVAGHHQWSSAQSTLDDALRIARAIPAPYAEVKLLTLAGEIALSRQRPDEARQAYAHALQICDLLGERLYRPHIQRTLDALEAKA